MRLLHTDTFTLRNFVGTDCPDYAILSHTWIDDEIIFQDFTDGHIKDEARSKRAFPKVYGACRQAASDEFEWIWIDSLCIDKSSSSELQEAINSMWSWYKDACICYAYLEDIPNDTYGWNKTVFRLSRWFTRGWTLQELIAPCYVAFFSADWKPIGTKLRRMDEICEVTGIAKDVLETGNIADHNAAEIMSWAAHRGVSRDEDMAYSLMGLFDINMPMLYGEGGTKAFLRLQEAIYKHWADDTLFLWTYTPSSELPALLAEHPRQFCRAVNPCTRCNPLGGWTCFPKNISYQEISPIRSPVGIHDGLTDGHMFPQELMLRRHGVQVNLATIERDEATKFGYLGNLLNIPRELGRTLQGVPAPIASAIAVLGVMDSRLRFYCLEIGSSQRLSAVQRLPTLGLLPAAAGLSGRMAIEIHTPRMGKTTYCLSFEFQSNYFHLRTWLPARTLEVYESMDDTRITINSNMADLSCSLVAYDPSRTGRQITVGLVHRGLENGNLRICSVILEDGETIGYQTPETFSTDQHQLDLADGSTVLISVQQLPNNRDPSIDEYEYEHRYRIQITRSGLGGK